MAQGSQVPGPFYAVTGGKISKNYFGFFKGFLSVVFVLQEVMQETDFCLTQEQGRTVTVPRVGGWNVTSKGDM